MEQILEKRIKEREAQAKSYREIFEKRWYISLASENSLFFANMNIMRNELIISPTEIPSDPRIEWRKYFSINLLSRIYNSLLDRILQIIPVFSCYPATIQAEDMVTSKIAQKLLDGIISPKIEEILYDLFFWVLWVDTTLVKVGYKENAGKYILVPEITKNPEEGIPLEFTIPILDENKKFKKIQAKDLQGNLLYQKLDPLTKEPAFKRIYEGDLVYRVISPFNYLIDPNAFGIDCLINPDCPTKARWVMTIDYFTEDDLLERDIDVAKFEKEGEEFSSLPDFLQKIYSTLRASVTSTQKMWRYKEYYEIPSKHFPNGLYVKMIGNKILEVNDLPLPFRNLGVLPFVDFRDNPKAYLFYNQPKLFQVRDIVKEYIKTISKISSIIEKVGDKVLIGDLGRGRSSFKVHRPQDSLIVSEVFDVPSPAPGAFQITELDSLPMALLRYLEVLLMNLEYLTASYDIRYPLRERTATEIEQTIATAEASFSPFRRFIIKRYEKLASYGLEIIKHYYTDGRKIEIGGGEFGLIEVLIFNKQDLTGKYNIRYAYGEMMTMSKLGRLMYLRQLLQIPHLAQVITPQTVMNILNLYENFETMETQADVKRATQENLKILYDIEYVPYVDFYDNHMVHIQTHEKFVKINYERISPDIMQKYKIHILDHFRKIAEQQEEIKRAQEEGRNIPQETTEEVEESPMDIDIKRLEEAIGIIPPGEAEKPPEEKKE